MTITDTRVTTIPRSAARQPDEPRPDVLDYRLVHRAMTVDFDRLASTAAELVERPDPSRMVELRRYLDAVSGEVESHHQVEDEHVWPLLVAVAGEHPPLAPLTGDHERLDPLLRRAGELAATGQSTLPLATVLREVADLLGRHVADEERDIFPLIEERVRVEDYQRLQERFRANLRMGLLPFVVPWAVSHATPEERPAVIASAPWPLRILLMVFERPFRARQERLFAPAGLSPADRKRVRRMRRFAAVHATVLRASGGRIGSRWLGGSDVLMLTVSGRKSGQPHTVPLMCLRDGDDLLVAASQGGVDREPQWWLNLLADPRADVEVRGERFAVTAQRVGDHERPQLWARFVATFPGFEDYQAKVQRQISVVRLRRAP